MAWHRWCNARDSRAEWSRPGPSGHFRWFAGTNTTVSFRPPGARVGELLLILRTSLCEGALANDPLPYRVAAAAMKPGLSDDSRDTAFEGQGWNATPWRAQLGPWIVNAPSAGTSDDKAGLTVTPRCMGNKMLALGLAHGRLDMDGARQGSRGERAQSPVASQSATPSAA